MPTIEFFGYSQEQSMALVKLSKQLFSNLPFREHIVYVLRQDDQSKVVAWDGKECPFIRILTRSSERAALLKERLNAYTDIEIILIDFSPKTKM